MTRLYLYAIADRPRASLPAGTFLEDGGLLSLAYGDIAAVVGPIGTVNPSPTEANLWQHETAVEALMADRAVLPVRFGMVLPDNAAALSLLAERYGEFTANLERVRGRVELSLRVLWEEAPPPVKPAKEPGIELSGKDYLMARLEEERQRQAWRWRAEALAGELHEPLALLAFESTFQALVTPCLLLSADYLLDRRNVSAFLQGVKVLSAAHPALHFLCTGPWPPYSFVAGHTSEASPDSRMGTDANA